MKKIMTLICLIFVSKMAFADVEIIKSPILGKAIQIDGLLQVFNPRINIGYDASLYADERTAMQACRLLKKEFLSYSFNDRNLSFDAQFFANGELVKTFSQKHIEILRCK